MNLVIKEINEKKDKRAFIDFPHQLYSKDPFYVPELYIGMSELLNEQKNPFFNHSEVQLFLAFDHNKIVGRIAAILNNNYNNYHNSNIGFFGFFDVIENFEVAKALLERAKQWLKDKNVDAILGPTNFSTNDTAGLLVEGFEESPKVMMTYNARYYQSFIERFGFIKEMDLFAYMIKTDEASERSLKLSKRFETRLKQSGIIIRPLNIKNWKEEIKRLKIVYNQAWEKNWGFVPFTDAEFDHLAEGLKMLADPKFCYIAEAKGKTIGFSITLPNINEILIQSKKGRLFPFTLFNLLLNKKKTKYVRILALGVIEAYRKKGIEAIFFAKNIAEAKRRKIIGGEASWILENNDMMNVAAKKLNGKKYKTYRLYRLNLNHG